MTVSRLFYPPVMAKLTFVLEEGQEVVVPLVDAATVTLGRGDDNDVVVDDLRVSKHHAALERNPDGRLSVRDLNSTAGTYVNGERVESCCIKHGDRLAFGPLTAVFDVEEYNGHSSHGSDSPTRLIRSRTKTTGSARTGTRVRPSREMPGQTQEPESLPEKARLETELAGAQAELKSWRERAAQELQVHTLRVEALRAEERRLARVTAAAQEAEALHQQWQQTAEKLAAECAEKQREREQLARAEAAAKEEMAALTHQQEQLAARLDQVRLESERQEAHLSRLHQQAALMEERSKSARDLAEAREDQVKVAEKRLEQAAERRTRLEAHILELSGTEHKLALALERLHEAEASQAALAAVLAPLRAEQQQLEGTVRELQARVTLLQGELQQESIGLGEVRATKQHAEQTLRALEMEIKLREAEQAAATRRVEAAEARRAGLEQQCSALEETKQQLAVLQQEVATAAKRHSDVRLVMEEDEAQVRILQARAAELQQEEQAAQERVAALELRATELHAELEKMAAAEQGGRARFEEIQQLIHEAEQEHTAQQEAYADALSDTRQELEELESTLKPLRDWKEAMDQLYDRLAALPEGSEEARRLWHEIENEKADLKKLIATARSQARGVAPPRSVSPPQAPGAPSSVLAAVIRGRTAETPASVPDDHLPAGGALLVQERTLKARLGHLQESVRQEEARLELLRHESGRLDLRGRAGGAAGDAIKREHDRHLESKIRHDEEHLRALHHALDVTKAEEEKRRHKIAELEHRLTELQADITEGERQRSDLRQQAELTQAQLKNLEAAVERMKRLTQGEEG